MPKINVSGTNKPPTASSSKLHSKLISRTDKSRSKSIGADSKPIVTCKEIDIDEWHTREACEHYPHARSGLIEEDTKSVTNSAYLPNLGTDFNVLVDYAELKLPELEGRDRTEAVRCLGEELDLLDYETNLVSYWVLEMLSTTLLECQRAHMYIENQRMTLFWVIYILKTIMYYKLKRRELFKHLEELFIKAHPFACYKGVIPSPYLLLQEGALLETWSSLSEKHQSGLIESYTDLRKDGKNQKSASDTNLLKMTQVNSEVGRELKKDGREDNSQSQAKLSRSASQTKSRTGYRRSGHKSFRGRRGRTLSGISTIKKAVDLEKDADFLLFIDQIYSMFKYEVIYQVFADPVCVETITIAENIFKSKVSAPLPRTPCRPSTLKKSVTKIKISNEKRKPDTRKSLKDTFLQKLMKIVLEEPIEKEERKPESIFTPNLLPLIDAVEPKLFRQNQLPSPTKRSAGRKSVEKIKISKLRSA